MCGKRAQISGRDAYFRGRKHPEVLIDAELLERVREVVVKPTGRVWDDQVTEKLKSFHDRGVNTQQGLRLAMRYQQDMTLLLDEYEGCLVDFPLRCMQWAVEGQRNETTFQLLFPLGGAWPFAHMAEHANNLTGWLPKERIHRAWVTVKILESMRKDENQKVLFIRHLIQKGILYEAMPDILVVDTDRGLNHELPGNSSDVVFTETLFSDRHMSIAERLERVDIPCFSPNSKRKRGLVNLAFAYLNIKDKESFPVDVIPIAYYPDLNKRAGSVNTMLASMKIEGLTHLEGCRGVLQETTDGKVTPVLTKGKNSSIPVEDQQITWAYREMDELALNHAVERMLVRKKLVSLKRVEECDKR